MDVGYLGPEGTFTEEATLYWLMAKIQYLIITFMKFCMQ